MVIRIKAPRNFTFTKSLSNKSFLLYSLRNNDFYVLANVELEPGTIRIHIIVVQYTLLHCPINNLNISIKMEPVTVGADVSVYVWFLGQTYTVMYCMKTKAGHIPLHPRQP